MCEKFLLRTPKSFSGYPSAICQADTWIHRTLFLFHHTLNPASGAGNHLQPSVSYLPSGGNQQTNSPPAVCSFTPSCVSPSETTNPVLWFIRIFRLFQTQKLCTGSLWRTQHFKTKFLWPETYYFICCWFSEPNLLNRKSAKFRGIITRSPLSICSPK